MARREATRWYSVMRLVNTDSEFVVDMVEVEQVEATWTEFMKYVKKNYELKSVRRNTGMAFVK